MRRLVAGTGWKMNNGIAESIRYAEELRARIADVDIVVNRRAADIDAVLALLLGDKFLFLAGHGVEDLHSLHVPSSI